MDSNYWLITVLINQKSIKLKDKILYHMNKSGIKCRPVWQLPHTINVFKKYPRMKLLKAKLLEKIINLPSSPHLNIDEKNKIIVYGDGGHSTSCIDLIESTNKFKIVGVVSNKKKNK